MLVHKKKQKTGIYFLFFCFLKRKVIYYVQNYYIYYVYVYRIYIIWM